MRAKNLLTIMSLYLVTQTMMKVFRFGLLGSFIDTEVNYYKEVVSIVNVKNR